MRFLSGSFRLFCMVEKVFLWIVFTISTNFFYLLLFPTIIFFPLFFAWIFPHPLRWILGLLSLGPAIFFLWMVFTRMEPVLKWIYETGEVGEVVFSDYYASGNTINDQPEMIFAGTLKTQSGDLHDFKISAGGVLSYPFETPSLMTIQQVYRVKYRPSYPQFWVIDRGSPAEVQNRMECAKMRAEVNRLKSLLLLKPEDPQLKSQIEALEAKLKEQNC